MSASIKAHNAQLAVVWNAAGRDYERISESIADSIGHCVACLKPKFGERVLDVATGTGRAARQVALSGAEVVGIDLAADLINAGRTIASEAGLSIDFRVGDAERLEFEDASFDAVISTCGVMFARDPEAAAAELARVCKSEGRLALTTWPADGTVAALFKVMKPYMPEPVPPIPPSPFEWGDPSRVSDLLGRHFDLRFETGTSVLRGEDSIAVWDMFVTSYGPTKTLASKLPSGRMQALRDDFVAFHDQYKSDLGVALPRKYLVTVGVRR
jgi:SAM-dependent methyltransferase